MWTALRVAVAALASVLLGAVVGVVGTFQHPAVVTVGGARLPSGVVLGIAALVLAQVVARDAVPYAVGPALVLAGWTVVVAVLGTQTAAGDLAVPGDSAGETFLFGGFLVGLISAGLLAASSLAASHRAATSPAPDPAGSPADGPAAAPASGDAAPDR